MELSLPANVQVPPFQNLVGHHYSEDDSQDRRNGVLGRRGLGREWERDGYWNRGYNVSFLCGDDATVLVRPPPTIRLLLQLQLKHPPIAIRRPDFMCPDLIHPRVIQVSDDHTVCQVCQCHLRQVYNHVAQDQFEFNARGWWRGGRVVVLC